MIEIKEIRKQDYQKAQQFAIKGMHFDWYFDKGLILNLYSKYFWHMELNRATRAYGAYENGEFVGVLLADIKGEDRRYHSIWRSAFIKTVDALQYIVAGKGVGEYNNANRKMFACFCKNEEPDGEIVFLAADPKCKAKGIGTALLSALGTEEKGKLIYLYTDNACTYQFYEHRGFKRSEEQDIVIELNNKKVPLKCMLYSKKFDC